MIRRFFWLHRHRILRLESPKLSDLYKVGTVAYIKQVVKLPQDLLRVLVEGIERAELLSLDQEEPFLKAETALFEPDSTKYTKSLNEAMFRSIQELFQRYCMESGKISKDLAAKILNIEDIDQLITQVSVNVPLSYQNKQKILEAVSLEDRYEVLAAILTNEIEVFQVGHDLQRKLKSRVDKNQRDYICESSLKSSVRNWERKVPVIPRKNTAKKLVNFRLLRKLKTN